MRALETWAIVVAAGAGERLGADRPKAFVKFGERTLVAASLETFEDHDGIDGIVVAVPEGFETEMSLIADDLGAGKIAAALSAQELADLKAFLLTIDASTQIEPSQTDQFLEQLGL